MARIRSIKPSFFLSEELAQLTPLHRLLFIALWCIADREGRLYDKPATIKVQALPFDEGDVDAMLADLAAGPDPWLVRYAAPDGKRCIQIVKFLKHQNPHQREAKSEIPPISGAKTQSPEKAVLSTGPSLVEPRKGDAEPGGFGSGFGFGSGNGFGSGGATGQAELDKLLDSIGLSNYQRVSWFKGATLEGDLLLVDRPGAVEWIDRHYLPSLSQAAGRALRVMARGTKVSA